MTLNDPLKDKKKELHLIIENLKLPKEQNEQWHKDIKNSAEATFNQLTEAVHDIESKTKDAREIAKAAEPQHIGKYTPQALQQELFSLANTKPAFRDKKWNANYEKIMGLVGEIKDARVRDGIQDKARAMLSGES